MHSKNKNCLSLALIEEAQINIKEVVETTPLQYIKSFSELYKANIYFKREDLQVVRSYKIRGAFNKIKKLKPTELKNGIVCASAGNHAQGVALACCLLKVQGVVFMPITTPQQKITQVRMFGSTFIEIKLIGDTFDESYLASLDYCNEKNSTFVHPFNDLDVIAGQGTVGLEILQQIDSTIDYLFLPVGGGGLASGLGSVFKTKSPSTKLIGVEPKGAPSLTTSIKNGKNTELTHIDKFVDGAAVKKMGDITYTYCQDLLDEVNLIEEGLIFSTILKVYNENAMVIESAGAMSVSALELYKDKIKGKTIVCIISGGNNDITRMEEMKEKSLLYEGLKHYFLINFPQRAGDLKEFLVEVLGENDDITHFEYTKKNSRSTSTAVVGIELKNKTDFTILLNKMKEKGFYGEYLNDKPNLFQFIV